jgi:hypothetical protein
MLMLGFPEGRKNHDNLLKVVVRKYRVRPLLHDQQSTKPPTLAEGGEFDQVSRLQVCQS